MTWLICFREPGNKGLYFKEHGCIGNQETKAFISRNMAVQAVYTVKL